MAIDTMEKLHEDIDRVSFLKQRLPSGVKETCMERAILITEGYKENAADPIILRRSKALANVLNKMTVRIFDKELIVGDQSVSQQAGRNYPEFGWGWAQSTKKKVPRRDSSKHTNLALLPEAKANASSVIPRHDLHQIEHLNDGLYNNSNSWISNGEPSWAEIDLGDIYTVSKVVFGSEHSRNHRDRAAAKFQILVSTEYVKEPDHPSWRKVYEYDGEPVYGTKAFTFEPVVARWVRIHIEESAGGNVRIDEIEIYGDHVTPDEDYHELEEEKQDAQVEQISKFWSENPRLKAAGSLFGHTVPGFQKLIDKGFRGIRDEAQAKLDNMDPTHANELAKEPFWKAMIILAEAAGKFGKRYARKAEEMAEAEKNPQRKNELLRIAEVCQRVPWEPAGNFYEALQSLWFGHMMMELEDPPNAHSIGRIDQMLYPFYKNDLEAGTINEDEAYELLECFGLKIWKSYDVQDTMIGGQKPDGSDAVNDISFMYLDVVEKLDIHLQLSARYHKNIDKRFWRRVAQVNAQRRGLPQMFNDDVIIPALVEKGIPIEEARDYAIIGCIEVTIPGRCDPRVVNHYTNMLKCLEYALNDGVCLVNGNQSSLKTGKPEEFESFHDVMEAYKTQVAHDIRKAVINSHRAELEQRERFPMPFLTLLTDDCIEKGMDITAGGARYNSTGFCAYANANAGDSLAAIKKLVFDEKRVTLKEVVDAMRVNFEGKESLRQMLLNEAPKYGNDDDYVDSIVTEISEHFCRELEQYTNARGGDYHAHFLSFVLAVSGGASTAASADGRKAGEPVANSLAPQQGRDKKGITAMLKSISKIDQELAAAGTSLIFDIHPSAVKGEEGAENLDNLLRTYFHLGGGHAECNIVDVGVLRKAQKDPEKYSNLSVRVAGYSAYFVNLGADMQEHIIQKTKNML
ncbi:hypothetical protein GF312_22695 [Candidatus Poribacteria bacterium]|nr:hypothetical protein [Candidatus Poribacteria bacterium]